MRAKILSASCFKMGSAIAKRSGWYSFAALWYEARTSFTDAPLAMPRTSQWLFPASDVKRARSSFSLGLCAAEGGGIDAARADLPGAASGVAAGGTVAARAGAAGA